MKYCSTTTTVLLSVLVLLVLVQARSAVHFYCSVVVVVTFLLNTPFLSCVLMTDHLITIFLAQIDQNQIHPTTP